GIDELVYAGNHGLEWMRGEHVWVEPEAAPYAAVVAAALAELSARGLPDGVRVEDKGVTASLHYRQATDPEATARVLHAAAAEVCARHGLRLTEGRRVYELRPPIARNKGTALRRLVEQDSLDGVLFLGDDVTDVDGFLAVRAL